MFDYPTVSIIMPIRNEARYLARSLAAVLRQDYPSDRMEIIVADGLSNDGTRDILKSFQDNQHGLSLRIIDNPGRIVPCGLNSAIAQAKGDIIIRVDGHCEIAPDYVRCCVSHILNDGVDGVGGVTDTIGDTPLSCAIAIAMSSTFGVGGSAFRTVHDKTMFVDSIPFPAYTRGAIERAGLFDEELVRDQDDEYNYRLRKLGAKIMLAADVHSEYFSRSSFGLLWRQYYQYGYWKVRVLQKHPRQMRPRHFVPPVFVAALLGLVLLAPFIPLACICLFIVAGVYLVANLTASLWTAAEKGWKHLPALPLVYAILHLSYGSGFLMGLVKFAGRWGDRVGQVPSLKNANG